MAKVTRGGKGVRRAAKSQSRTASARRARAATTGILDRIMNALPFTEEQWQKGFLGLIFGGALALAWTVASYAGVPAMAQAEVSKFAKTSGFELKHVKVSGTQRMDEQHVYARAFRQLDRPMPQVDVDALRADLLQLPWVKDARVSVQLPQSLVIDIVERKPHAVLQKPDRLMLIDVEGNELEPISAAKTGDLLVVSGPGSAKQVEALDRLLSTAPALKPQIKAANWVGNRRWDLTFATDQKLALPEGEDVAATALVKFARLDGQNRLVGGKVATFDMRAPPRIYMRVPGRSEQQLEPTQEESE